MNDTPRVPSAPRAGVLPWSPVLKTIAGLLVGLLILGLWFYFVGLEETISTLATVTALPAILATLAWTLSLILRSCKWHTILLSTQQMSPGRPLSAGRPLSPLVTGRVYWVSSFLNVLFPFRVGELARSLLLKRLAGMPISTSLPTVLVDRLYSIGVILLSLLFLPLAPFHPGTSFAPAVLTGNGATSARSAAPSPPNSYSMWSIRWGLGIVAAGFLITLVILFTLRHQKTRLLHLAGGLLFFLPNSVKERLLGFLDATIDSMRFARSDARSAIALLAWSLAVLWVDALKDHFVLQAFGLDVPVTTCFFGVCLTNLAFILPSPPGNIGSNEWYATLVYTTGFGYDSARVASGALFGHVMTTLVVAVGGALSLSSLGISLTEGLRISRGEADE